MCSRFCDRIPNKSMQLCIAVIMKASQGLLCVCIINFLWALPVTYWLALTCLQRLPGQYMAHLYIVYTCVSFSIHWAQEMLIRFFSPHGPWWYTVWSKEKDPDKTVGRPSLLQTKHFINVYKTLFSMLGNFELAGSVVNWKSWGLNRKLSLYGSNRVFKCSWIVSGACYWMYM